MKHFLSTLAIVTALVTPSFALACNGKDCKMHHSAPKLSAELKKNHAVLEYINAMDAMHDDMKITYTGNADVDFVAGMIPHHQGAVDMAEVQIRYGKDEELRKLAEWIIRSQTEEMGFMKMWLAGRDSSWRADNVNALESVQAYNKAMDTMHHEMNISYTGDADIDFARGMIPHHQGAVDMAWVLKRHGIDPTLNKFADDIIVAQEGEIKFMKEWLAKHDIAKPAEKKKSSKKSKKSVTHHHDHASH